MLSRSRASKPDFADAARKIARANSHLLDLERAAQAYFKKHPWYVGMMPTRRHGRFGIPAGERRPFPDREFSLIIGDAVHNLRTSLDYLIAACALAEGSEIDQTEFPFGSTKASVLKNLKRRVRPAGELAQALVLRARPYQRGNKALWTLAELDRRDKHRLVVPTTCITDVRITSGGWNDLQVTAVTGRFRAGKGTFIDAAPGYEEALMMEASYSPEIIFSGPASVRGKPCLLSLWLMSSAASKVLQSFELAYGTVAYSDALLRSIEQRILALSKRAGVSGDPNTSDVRMETGAERAV
jgi:hypothetical protein